MATLLRWARGPSAARHVKPSVSAWSGAALETPLHGPRQRRWHSVTGTGTSSSVNPDEVARFTALASDWWDPHGAARALHLMNPLRHDLIQSCLRRSPPLGNADGSAQSLSYLDVGCGGGIFAESAARLPSTRHVTAVDPTASLLAVAQAHARKDPLLARKLTYKNCSLEQLDAPPPGEEYDVVSLFEVLEHVDEPRVLLERVRPFVKPGGWLVMSTIARTWMSWFVTILVAENMTGVVPRGTHDWAKYIDAEELHGYLEGRGWDSPRVMGVVYVPGLGWKVVDGSEKIGNYFFAVRGEPLSQG